MSEDETEAASGEPVEAAEAAVVQAPDYAVPTQGRQRGRAVAGIVAVLAVVAAGLFAVAALGDDGNTPEDAVRELLTAAAQTDVLGVLGALDPGEAAALRDSAKDITAQLNRLGILDGASLKKIEGLTLGFENVKLKTRRIDGRLAEVTVTGGRASYRVDPAKLPIGPFVRGLVGAQLGSAEPTSGEEAMTATKGDAGIVTVKRGSRWYVSLGYSVAEPARADAGISLESLGDGVPARGADTPQAAVDAFLRSALRLDVRRLVELLPPDELPAVHEYAAMFVPKAEQGVASVRAAYAAAITALDLDADTSGDRSLVTVRKFAGSFRVGDVGLVVDGEGCVTVSMPGTPGQRTCGRDRELLSKLPIPGIGGLAQPTGPLSTLHTAQPRLGFVTTRVGGLWYVSPTRTGFDTVTAFLRVLDRGDLRQLVAGVQQAVAGAMTTGESMTVTAVSTTIAPR